jgi:hypothetical protein
MASLGIVLVVVGALAGWQYVASASSGSHPYLAIYQQVPVGEQITAADLQVVSIVPVHGLTPIPSSQMSRVVGQYAKVALVPGTLVTNAQLTPTNAVGPNQALVGLKLAATQRPGRALRPGDKVMLVAVPDQNGAVDADSPTLPMLQASVVDVGSPDTDNTAVVDVLLPMTNVSVVAALANESRVSVVLVSGS